MKRSILVVEEDNGFREELHRLLRDNYQVIEAATGEEALSIAELQQPELIIMDGDMPDRDGFDVCTELKSGVSTRTIPLLLLSSSTSKTDVINGLYSGADDYLTKPIRPAEILARVDAHLRGKGFYCGLEQNDLQMLLELSEIISVSRNPLKILQTIVERITRAVGVGRCSILSFTTNRELLVKASSDLPRTGEIRLELSNYPEISQAIMTKKTVVINDMTTDPLLEPVRDRIKNLAMDSVIVVPIVKKESIIGTFFQRTASPHKHAITERVYKLCHLVANMSANALENAALFELMMSKQRFLEEMALRDGLTALYNHQHFYTRIEEEFSRATRYGTPLSCLFFDIDNFKKVNDRYGHVCGDEVLRQIGRMLNNLIRESDIAARYGGEEFALLLPNATAEGALDLANRLRTAIGEIVAAEMDGTKITVSIGIATYVDDNMKTYLQLIKQADDAMYHSKKMGKDRITVATGRHAGLNP